MFGMATCLLFSSIIKFGYRTSVTLKHDVKVLTTFVQNYGSTTVDMKNCVTACNIPIFHPISDFKLWYIIILVYSLLADSMSAIPRGVLALGLLLVSHGHFDKNYF